MTTAEFIIALFYRIDNQMPDVLPHPQAALYPSEVVTLGVLYALKGGSKRAFYRWLVRDWRAFFPRLPERTRLFRLLAAHADWTDAFRAEPSTLGVVDSYGIELIHPIREGRSPQQMGRKGLSNHRWIVGGKLCLIVNQWGPDRRLGLYHRQRPRFGLSPDDWPLPRADDPPQRPRLPCPSRRPGQSESLFPQNLGRAHGPRDGLFDADPHRALQAADPSRLGLFYRLCELGRGRIQSAGGLAWMATRRKRIRPVVHR